ncbi:MAG: hypothetical protein IH994_01280 [Proteobacteria bacterium]|nr:hypothetical protein [Pseudomonadota bacterium]
MFGQKKEGKKKQRWFFRWFFKVESLDDAHDAMKIAYQTFYALAAIQGVIIGFLAVLWNTPATNLADPVFMVFLAWLIHLRQSRTAATLLMIYAIPIGFLTLMSRLGIPHDFSFGGKNIILAALAIYGAYKGIQGTFKFHALSKTEVIWKNVLIQTGIITIYVVLCIVVVFLMSFVPAFEPYFWGTGAQEPLPDEILGFIVLTPGAAVIVAGVFRILPGTRTREIVLRDQSDT